MSAIVNESFTLSYAPQNVVFSICMQVFGPPLDSLKKAAEVYNVMKRSSIVERKTKWWLAVAGTSIHLSLQTLPEMIVSSVTFLMCAICPSMFGADFKLFFFQSFGDAQPRLVANIKDSTVSQAKNNPNLIIIILADRRKWQLELTSAFDVNRMLFALVEGKRAVETGVSSYLHPSSIQTMTSRIL